jgi:4-amino-4-deoxy-L-arabinose transferase-like glycosyltransferase
LTEREWREASDMRTPKVALAIVMIVAAVFRFWGLRRGLPYSPGVDEPEIVGRAIHMMKTGNLNPQPFFDYPTLYMYVQLVVYIVRFIVGAMNGMWNTLDQITLATFYEWGRAVTALLGTATVYLVYMAGMRWGARHALLAAAILAVMPQHVRDSHFVLTDVPMTFFVTLGLVLTMAASESPSAKRFAFAGAASGLAAATKYNGGLALMLPLIACAMLPRGKDSRISFALSAIAASAVAFLVFAPYTVLELPAFLNSFGKLAGHYQSGATPGQAPAITYFKHLRIQFGTPALLLIIAGLILGIVRIARGPGRLRWLLVISFSAAYFYLISGQKIVFARYLQPIIPMLCLLAAAAVISGVSLLRRYEIPRAPRTALIVALTCAAILPGGIMSFKGDLMAARKWSTDMAYEWIVENIPQGSSVIVETRAMLLPPEYKSANVIQIRYKPYEEYVSEGWEYLVASSEVWGRFIYEPEKFPAEYADYMRIFERSKELVRFTPPRDNPDKLPGPEWRIYKVKP